jgi:hypothetical protein
VAKRGEVKIKAVKAAPAKQAAVKAPTEAWSNWSAKKAALGPLFYDFLCQPYN